MENSGSRSLASVYIPMAAVAAGVIVVDQVTKMWADDLERCQLMVDRPKVGFCLAYNEGMAFSVGWGAGLFISIVAVAIVGVLIVAARKVPRHAVLLMGGVCGGALGNVIDRAFRAPAPGSTSTGAMSGAVIDFLYSDFWATFNIADAAIVTSGILLSIVLWRLPDPTDSQPVETSAPAETTS